jgi:hypothetical protein
MNSHKVNVAFQLFIPITAGYIKYRGFTKTNKYCKPYITIRV